MLKGIGFPSTYEKWQDQVIDFHKDGNLEWGAVWMLIYPNIMVEWYPQTIVVSTLYPLEAQKTLNITEFYYAEEIAWGAVRMDTPDSTSLRTA